MSLIVSFFITYSQSECRKAVVYSSRVIPPNLPVMHRNGCVGPCLIFNNMVENNYAKLSRDIPRNLPLVTCIVSLHKHKSLGKCVYEEKK